MYSTSKNCIYFWKVHKNSVFKVSTDMAVSLIATQKNSCSRNLFKDFRTYGCAVGMISLTWFLSQHPFVRTQFSIGMQNSPQTPTWYPQSHGMFTSGTLWRLLNGCSYCFHILWRSNGPRSARWFSFQCGFSCPKVRNPQQYRFPVWYRCISTEREACTERSLRRYHRTAVLIIRFNNKTPMSDMVFKTH